LDTDISNGSVATHLRCGRIFWWQHYNKCSPDSDREISLKIGQYMTKLRRTKQIVPVFWGHPQH